VIYVSAANWGWFLGSVLIGLAMGWISVVNRGDGLSRVGLQRAGSVLAAAILVSLLRLLPGRPGYWLDLALTMMVFYAAGCVIGAQLRHFVVSRTPPSA
jgi:hypothetical protein